MGELIRREAATAPLGFSGERLTGAVSGQIEIEHSHRYLLARDFCRGQDVLDVASGEGYGAALLAQVARSVEAVELDAAVVAAARREFGRPNLRFHAGDARALPLADASVDVAVSFETLEHLHEQEQFLRELRRVLRPAGLLVISTPDRDIYSPLGAAPNPFHVLELTRAEFEELLGRHFAHVHVAGQRPLIGSVIAGPGPGMGPARTVERRGDTHWEGSEGLARAPYLVALASDAALPPLPASVYVHRSDIDTDPQTRREAELAARAAQAARDEAAAAAAAAHEATDGARRDAEEARNELARVREDQATAAAESARSEAALRRDAELSRVHANRAEHRSREAQARHDALAAQLADARRQEAAAEARAAAADAQAAAAAQQARELQDRLDEAWRYEAALEQRLGEIEASTVWRASGPARQFGARHPRLARNLGRGAKLAWWTGTLQLRRRYRLWQGARRRVPGQLPEQLPEQLPAVALTPPALPVPPAARHVDIRIPSSATPVVSILVCTYGQVEKTLACLQSVVDHPPAMPAEVIVVDDAYPGPEDVSVLARVQGIRLVRNPENLGFLRSCNRAARDARGRYLLLLNNDAELRPGSVNMLAALLDRRPDAGMAGSRLAFPDGRQQEAGGIIWDDASGWNYGRGEDPARPEFNYVREVDYCSGASLMVRRDAWEALGGFDEAFAPAYYEDADLAFRMRARGLKVLYEPDSTVVHHEGASHGTDIAQGGKAHQAANRDLMLRRWGEVLAREHYPNGTCVLRARDRARARPVALVFDHYTPEPDRDAGSRSVMGIVEAMLDAGWLVKFWPQNRLHSATYTPPLERLGIEVLDRRWPGDFAAWMRENGRELDHILAVRPYVAADMLPDIEGQTEAVRSFYGVDLHCARMRRQAALDGNPALLANADAMEAQERWVWDRFDVVLYPSDEEAREVSAMAPGVLARGIVPFSFEAAPPLSGPVGERSLLFVAGFAHPPNVDAALFLLREVVPLLEREVGPVRVTLAGSNPTEEVRQLAGLDVLVTGYVTDAALAELYRTHRAAVVPLRFGAGVKGKVVEALSRGLPLVTTAVGAQGIEGLGCVVPVADDADGIARALARLMTDDAAWAAQSAAQVAFAEQRFSRAAMGRSVMAALTAGAERRSRHG